MFTDIDGFEEESVNKRSDLVPGLYVEKQFTFTNEAGDVELILRKFVRDDDPGCSVVDAMLIDSGVNEITMQDFFRMTDGNWRAGDGNISANLLDLMPADFIEMRLIDELDEGDVIEVSGELM